MQSFINRTRTFLTPSGSSTNLPASGTFKTEKSATALFQQTDPLIDGEDCLHDCSSCAETLPRKWEIDEEDQLYGHVNGWQTHLIVGTGKTDWVRDVVDEKGSLMQAVGKVGLELANGKVMLSASNLPSGHSHSRSTHDSEVKVGKEGDYPNEGRTRCLVFPKWEWVEGVGTGEAKWLVEEVLAKSVTNSTPLNTTESNLKGSPLENNGTGEMITQNSLEEAQDVSETDGLSLRDNKASDMNPSGPSISQPSTLRPAGVTIQHCQHRAVILMCSHGTRDWRCGKSAPILKREFERHLRPLGLYRDYDDERPGGVGVYFINHVGGHKYSANVMIYRREGRKGELSGNEELRDEAVQGIWLARVRPEDCENIVKYTVLQGKLLKPQKQLRGGFDRERGVLSW